MQFTMLKQIEELKEKTNRQEFLEEISDVSDSTFKMFQEEDYTINVTSVYWL